VVRTRTYRAGKVKLEGCDVANIPLQKWVNVSYVLDNRVVDMYINGKLERSCVLRRLPWLNNGPLYFLPSNPGATGGDQDVGFFGQVSCLRYFSSALRPVDVARLYNEGPHACGSSQVKKPDGTGSNGKKPACPPSNAQAIAEARAALKKALHELPQKGAKAKPQGYAQEAGDWISKNL